MFYFDYPKVKYSLTRTALQTLIPPGIWAREELFVAQTSWLSGYGIRYNSLNRLDPMLCWAEVFLASLRITLSAFP